MRLSEKQEQFLGIDRSMLPTAVLSGREDDNSTQDGKEQTVLAPTSPNRSSQQHEDEPKQKLEALSSHSVLRNGSALRSTPLVVNQLSQIDLPEHHLQHDNADDNKTSLSRLHDDSEQYDRRSHGDKSSSVAPDIPYISGLHGTQSGNSEAKSAQQLPISSAENSTALPLSPKSSRMNNDTAIPKHKLQKHLQKLHIATKGFGGHSYRIYPVAGSPNKEGEKDENDDIGELASCDDFRDTEQSAIDKLNQHQFTQVPMQTVHVTPVKKTSTSLVPSITHRTIFLKSQAKVAGIFAQPAEAVWGRWMRYLIFCTIIVNIAMLALETCDGPNFASSDPDYPYLLTKSGYRTMDAVISIAFTIEVVGRAIVRRFIPAAVKSPFTWLDAVALLPWYIQLILGGAGVDINLEQMTGPGHYLSLIRLLRLVRLGSFMRTYEGFKILALTLKASARPLSITMFFLFTLVIVLATALFYAEPCYNVNTCSFTDILNTAYFILVTVTTVGYGHQLPSLSNWSSLLITCIAMIVGQMYFGLPVAIVGNNFDAIYENFQLKKKHKLRNLDITLSPFDCEEMDKNSKRLCDIQHHLLEAIRVIQLNAYKMIKKNKAEDAGTKEMLQAQVTRHENIKIAVDRMLSVYTEACEIVQIFMPQKTNENSTSSFTKDHSESVLSSIYVRARKAMGKPKPDSNNKLGTGARLESWKERIWLTLEVPDSSRHAALINKALVVLAMLSVMLFCCESLRELAASGVATSACKRVVYSYCSERGYSVMDPGCFSRFSNGSTNFAERLDFKCVETSDASDCYGFGINFGSTNDSTLACVDTFDPKGIDLICYRQQCAENDPLVDMEPCWIYFEWFIGLIFTVELFARLYASNDRLEFWKDFYIVFDVLAIVPFFVEVLEYMVMNVQPVYSLEATSPSFLSVIRVLKTMRILKLTRHFRGTKVLARTAQQVWTQLTIPIFFLLTGCILASAAFYEIERGTECFVGKECIWWNKSILTPDLAAGLPDGKRILIQDTRRTIITDMLHALWLSYATLTSVGYGDLVPRTAIGRVFCMVVVVTATIYSAMPVSLVGTKFCSLYEEHVEKMVIKRGGSSTSWRSNKKLPEETKSPLPQLTPQPLRVTPRQLEPLFELTDKEVEAVEQFQAARRTIVNLQRAIDNLMGVGMDILRRKKSMEGEELPSVMRNIASLENSVEQKMNAVMDTLLAFSIVVEKLQDAPADYELTVKSGQLVPSGNSHHVGKKNR